MVRTLSCLAVLVGMLAALQGAWAGDLSYPVVDTGQTACFDDTGQIDCPGPGEPFFGQDAQYLGNAPRYVDNGDGTVGDAVTGLMWVKARGPRMAYDEIGDAAADCRVGGFDDWRVPTIKEVYSLIDFSGWMRGSEEASTPFIDTTAFDWVYGDESQGVRFIDSQDASATRYVSTTMGGAATFFGVNFADGRIKGYPMHGRDPGQSGRYVRFVRGNPNYGRNDFAARGAVVEDRATGLTWQRGDSGRPMDWQAALAWCEGLDLAGRDDWRLPNAKELQSIVDYTRAPAATGSAAVDPVFSVSEVESYYWTSTTHLDGPGSRAASHAAYVAFGRAMGYMSTPGSSAKQWIDVHGAGAQRSDPKSGDPDDYPTGFGPQGDDRRIENYVRCVAGGARLVEPANEPIQGLGGASTDFFGGTDAGVRSQDMRPDTTSERQMRGRRAPSGAKGRNALDRETGGSRRGPPAEAVAACRGKARGQGCVFAAPHGKVRGICGSAGASLACVPKATGGGRRP